jgi:hypothetical protein
METENAEHSAETSAAEIHRKKVASINTNFSKHDTAFGKLAGPILALSTVFATFFLFGYFVFITNSHSQEINDVNACLRDMALYQHKLDEAMSPAKSADAKAGSAPAEKKISDEEIKIITNSLANTKINCDYAKASLDTAKDRQSTMKEIILYVLGVLSSALTTILGYYFGSSKGSSEKNHAINAIATQISQ